MRFDQRYFYTTVRVSVVIGGIWLYGAVGGISFGVDSLGIDAVQDHEFGHIHRPDGGQLPVRGETGIVNGRVVCMPGDGDFVVFL